MGPHQLGLLASRLVPLPLDMTWYTEPAGNYGYLSVLTDRSCRTGRC